FLNKLKMISMTNNLGDSRTIAAHPASTTHSKLTEEERQAVGITPGLIRISVGLVHPDDIIADIEQVEVLFEFTDAGSVFTFAVPRIFLSAICPVAAGLPADLSVWLLPVLFLFRIMMRIATARHEEQACLLKAVLLLHTLKA